MLNRNTVGNPNDSFRIDANNVNARPDTSNRSVSVHDDSSTMTPGCPRCIDRKSIAIFTVCKNVRRHDVVAMNSLPKQCKWKISTDKKQRKRIFPSLIKYKLNDRKSKTKKKCTRCFENKYNNCVYKRYCRHSLISEFMNCKYFYLATNNYIVRIHIQNDTGTNWEML